MPAEKKIIKNKNELIKHATSSLRKERKDILEILEQGILAADPYKSITKILSLDSEQIYLKNRFFDKLSNFHSIYVIGFGKAVRKMALAIEDLFGDNITEGIICVPKKIASNEITLKKIHEVEASHPLSNEKSMECAKRILNLLEKTTTKDLVIFLISGGGSALMELPIKGLPLFESNELFKILTKKGANIHEINTLRKHLSRVKGGKLAIKAKPAKVLSFIISDVIHDNLDVIASGPSVLDESTWEDVQEIVKKYELLKTLPDSSKHLILKGIHGELDETPKFPHNFSHVKNILVFSNSKACKAMKKLALQKKYLAKIYSTTISGSALKTAREFIDELKSSDPGIILIGGGETTVKITGKGKGGRNQELVLSACTHLSKDSSIIFAAIASDGKDGPTNAAGALIDRDLIKKSQEKQMNPIKYLKNNDSYHFFEKIDGLIFTGPTGTNIMDLLIGLKMIK
ncbi:MAG: DUF4147 domain-containing protein [Asgard group archaeon]|nr:DUF4147 domain-containing protein [Asgard group archaeon]